MQNSKDEERMIAEYPMYMRYWCCGLKIGSKHSPDCPSVPTRDVRVEDQKDFELHTMPHSKVV